MLQDEAILEEKYQLFIEKTAASKLVWGLNSKEGWANSHSNDDEEIDVIPFWSDRALAKACARDDWKSFSPSEIRLADFLENWCPDMANDGMLVGINWDANMLGKEVTGLQLALDILKRLDAIKSAITFSNYSSIAEFMEEISQALEQ